MFADFDAYRNIWGQSGSSQAPDVRRQSEGSLSYFLTCALMPYFMFTLGEKLTRDEHDGSEFVIVWSNIWLFSLSCP